MKAVLRPLATVQQEIRSNVCGLPTQPNLPRGKLEDELLGADHPELIPGNPLYVYRVGAEGFDLALERRDLPDQLLVGFTELLKLSTEVTIAGQALLIEDQRRNRHDGHHHQGKRKKRSAWSHGPSLPQPGS